MSEETKTIRQEFAKAFGWYKDKMHYQDINTPKTPSWEEIFVEVGRLLAKQSK